LDASGPPPHDANKARVSAVPLAAAPRYCRGSKVLHAKFSHGMEFHVVGIRLAALVLFSRCGSHLWPRPCVCGQSAIGVMYSEAVCTGQVAAEHDEVGAARMLGGWEQQPGTTSPDHRIT
jgi:hypothetical protein